MLIKKIEIENFRQFSGKHDIVFSTDVDRNITLVMGDNGTGKTTLAQAFLWCLYGATDFKIKEVINRDVRDRLMLNESANVQVNLYMEKTENFKPVLYRITRRQTFIRQYSKIKADNSKFEISLKNEMKGEWEPLKEGEARVLIKKTLPQELSRFFVFDGERIQKLSDEIESGKSKEFANAVQGLVGLTVMLKTMDHMKPSGTKNTVIGSLLKEINKNGSSELRKYSEEIEGYDEIILKNKPLLKELNEEIDNISKAVESYQKELFSMSDAIEIKNKYKAKEAAIEVKTNFKNDKTTKLLKEFSKNAISYFSMPLSRAALIELEKSDDLEKGIPALHIDTINFLLNRGECICGCNCSEGTHEAEVLKGLLDVALPKTIGQSIGNFADGTRSRIRSSESFEEHFNDLFLEVCKCNNEIDVLQSEATRLYNEITDTSKADTLKKNIDESSKLFKDKCTEKGKLENEIANAEKSKGYAESKRDALMLIDKQNKETKLTLAYARYVYLHLEQSYKAKEALTREKLENCINDIFKNIYNTGIKLEVDKNYGLKVIVTDTSSSGDELERNTAQNYAIIFAFITAIIKLTKEKSADDEMTYCEDGYPLIMDAPLSAFDKKRIKNICDTIPEIAQQVIMFIKDTDGDIAEENLSDMIGKKYMLKEITQTTSSINEMV